MVKEKSDVKKTEEDTVDASDGRREFTIEISEGNTKKYYIGIPTAENIRAADWHHAKVYNRGLREGIFTAAEMMEILKERNIIGEQYEATAEELRIKLSQKLIDMETETDRDRRAALAMEAANLREQVFQWNQRLSSPLSSTCESIANDARTEYLTFCLIEEEDGTKLWESFDEYKAEKNVRVQTQARFEVMLWLEGVESDFLSNVPENKVLSEQVDANKLAESAPDADLLKAVSEDKEKAVDTSAEKPAESLVDKLVKEVVPKTSVTPKAKTKADKPVKRGRKKGSKSKKSVK